MYYDREKVDRLAQAIYENNKEIENRISQEKQAQADNDSGYLDNLARGFKAGASSVIGGAAQFVGADGIAKSFTDTAAANAPRKEHTGIYDSLSNFVDYATDPQGLAYDIGSQGGSMAALAPVGMLASAAVPATAGVGAAAVGANVLGRLGMRKAAQAIGTRLATEGGRRAINSVVKTAVGGAATAAPESASAGGNAELEAIRMGYDPEVAKGIGRDVAMQNLPMLMGSNAFEYLFLGGKLFSKGAKVGESTLQRLAKLPVRTAPGLAANVMQQSFEELVQQTISDKELGREVGNVFDPSTWTDSQADAFQKALAPSAIIGGAPSVYRGMRASESADGGVNSKSDVSAAEFDPNKTVQENLNPDMATEQTVDGMQDGMSDEVIYAEPTGQVAYDDVSVENMQNAEAVDILSEQDYINMLDVPEADDYRSMFAERALSADELYERQRSMEMKLADRGFIPEAYYQNRQEFLRNQEQMEAERERLRNVTDESERLQSEQRLSELEDQERRRVDSWTQMEQEAAKRKADNVKLSNEGFIPEAYYQNRQEFLNNQRLIEAERERLKSVSDESERLQAEQRLSELEDQERRRVDSWEQMEREAAERKAKLQRLAEAFDKGKTDKFDSMQRSYEARQELMKLPVQERVRRLSPIARKAIGNSRVASLFDRAMSGDVTAQKKVEQARFVPEVTEALTNNYLGLYKNVAPASVSELKKSVANSAPNKSQGMVVKNNKGEKAVVKNEKEQIGQEKVYHGGESGIEQFEKTKTQAGKEQTGKSAQNTQLANSDRSVSGFVAKMPPNLAQRAANLLGQVDDAGVSRHEKMQEAAKKGLRVSEFVSGGKVRYLLNDSPITKTEADYYRSIGGKVEQVQESGASKPKERVTIADRMAAKDKHKSNSTANSKQGIVTFANVNHAYENVMSSTPKKGEKVRSDAMDYALKKFDKHLMDTSSKESTEALAYALKKNNVMFDVAERINTETDSADAYKLVNEFVADNIPHRKLTRVKDGVIVELLNGNKLGIEVNADVSKLDMAVIEKGAKDHGIDFAALSMDDIKQMYRGWYQQLDSGGIISLTEYADRSTLNHELIHAVAKTVLSERELNALYKYYNRTGKAVSELSGAQMRQLEEKIANSYADWMEARARDKSSMFGALWRKVRDFAEKVKSLLRGLNHDDVFKRIESGEVLKRDKAQTGTTNAQDIRHSINVEVDPGATYAPLDIGGMVDHIGDTRDSEQSQNRVISYIKNQLTGQRISVSSADLRLKYGFDFVDDWNAVHVAKAMSSKGRRNNESRIARNITLSNFEDVLKHSILVEINANPLKKDGHYAAADHQDKVAAVMRSVMPIIMPNGDLRTLVITSDSMSKDYLKNGIKVSLYELATRKVKTPSGSSFEQADGANQQKNSVGITLSEMLWNVKDLHGEYYVNHDTGELNVESDFNKRFDIDNEGAKVQEDDGIQFSIFGKKKAEPKETVTRKDVLNALKEIVPVRNGKISPPVQYDNVSGVLRSKFYGDFPNLAHGLGYFVDSKIPGLKPYYYELTNYVKGLEEYQGIDDGLKLSREGVAKFVSMYLENKELAKTEFPQFYRAFESELSAVPEYKTKFDEVHRMLGKWYEQSPGARVSGSISTKDSRSMKEKLKDKYDSFYRDWFDKLDPLHKLSNEISELVGRPLEYVEDVYKQARMATNIARKRAEMLLFSKSVKVDLGVLREKYPHLKYDVSMYEVLKDLKDMDMNKKYPGYLSKNGMESWQDALSAYLAANAYLERREHNEKYTAPFSDADAAAMVKNAPKEVSEAAEKIYKYNENLIGIMLDSGVISQEQYNAANSKYKRYAPLFRDFTDDADMDSFFAGISRGGSGIGNVSSPLKRLEDGSTRNIINPLDSIAKNTFTIIDRAERNKVAQTFVDLSRVNGVGRFVEELPAKYKDKTIKDEHGNSKKIRVRVDGVADAKKGIFIVMIDGDKRAFQTTGEFYDAIAGYSDGSAVFGASLFRAAASTLRTGATMTPEFMIRNFFRDNIFAALSSQTGFIPFIDSYRAMKRLRKDEKFRAEIDAAGIPLSGMVGYSRDTGRDVMGALGKMVDARNKSPKDILHSLIAPFLDASELLETSTRAAEYMRAREKGFSLEEAGLMAKELTLDFSRSGVYGQKYNQIVPFFNAVLQGGDKMFRLLKYRPTHTLWQMSKFIMLPSILLWAVNNDEEWYKDLPDDVKNSNWVWKAGDTIYRLPKPQEAGLVFGSGVERALDVAFMGAKPKVVKEWSKEVVNTFLPNLLPTLILPMIEWQANYSFFTGKNVVGKREQRLPDAEQYTPYTSEMAKYLGSITGLSPIKIDNTIKGYSGSTGSFVATAIDPLLKEGSPEKKWSEVAGVRNFTYAPNRRSQAVSDWYEIYDDIQKGHAAFGLKGKPKKYVSEANKLNSEIAKINKMIRDTTVSKGLSPEQKRIRIDNMNIKIIKLAKSGVRSFGKYVDE